MARARGETLLGPEVVGVALPGLVSSEGEDVRGEPAVAAMKSGVSVHLCRWGCRGGWEGTAAPLGYEAGRGGYPAGLLGVGQPGVGAALAVPRTASTMEGAGAGSWVARGL